MQGQVVSTLSPGSNAAPLVPAIEGSPEVRSTLLSLPLGPKILPTSRFAESIASHELALHLRNFTQGHPA